MDVTSLTVGAVEKLIEKPLERLGELGADKFAAAVSKWKNHNNRTFLARQLLQISKVKTLWHRDRAVNIYSFYYPLNIIVPERPFSADLVAQLLSSSEYARSVSLLSELPGRSCIVEGTVGQGKSIFLRYLICEELRRGGRIPLYIESKNIDKSENLRANIYALLKSLKFEISDELFDFYAESGAFVLALDAFDELHESLVNSTIKELERLMTRYPELQVVVTSRLKNDIQNVGALPVVRLAYLDEKDYEPFLRKLAPSADLPSRICAELKKSPKDVKEVLRTPLMLTLLLVKFIYTESVPQAITDFYKDLFRTVLSGHDRLKAGYRRTRACTLSDDAMERAFDAFCFITRMERLAKIPKGEFEAVVVRALSPTGIQVKPSAFKDDLIKVACLMQEEGHDVAFSHKSVQEFHAAAYVQKSPDVAASRFYSWLIEGPWRGWRQEIAFLKELDAYRWTKSFHLPMLKRARTAIDNVFGNVTELYLDTRIGLRLTEKGRGSFDYLFYPDKGMETHIEYLTEWLFRPLMDQVRLDIERVAAGDSVGQALLAKGKPSEMASYKATGTVQISARAFFDATGHSGVKKASDQFADTFDSLVSKAEELIALEERKINIPAVNLTNNN